MSPSHALLGLLVDDARHGYDLKRTIDREFAPFWQIDFAQLYRSLSKMTRAGWVKSRVQAGQGAPDRKVYALTPLGRRILQEWLAQPARDHDEFIVKVRLASTCGAPVAHLVESQRRSCENARAVQRDAHRAARNAGDAERLIHAEALLHETDASLAVLDLCSALLPGARDIKIAASPAKPIVITGSDDPLLAHLAERIHVSAHAVGSLGGLMALAQHESDVAGIHLLDIETGAYNVPFVKHLAPEDDIVLVNLAVRENGLMLASGNPKAIRGLSDLTRRDIRFINRQRGAGTRLLLYAKLRAAHIDPHALRDWEHGVATHAAVAAAIATSAADVGTGLRAVASAWGLEFIPLGEERFDLAIPRVVFESPRLEPMLDALQSAEFRGFASELQGYDLTRTGRVVARVK